MLWNLLCVFNLKLLPYILNARHIPQITLWSLRLLSRVLVLVCNTDQGTQCPKYVSYANYVHPNVSHRDIGMQWEDPVIDDHGYVWEHQVVVEPSMNSYLIRLLNNYLILTCQRLHHKFHHWRRRHRKRHRKETTISQYLI